MAATAGTATRLRLFDLGLDLALGHRPDETGNRSTGRRYQKGDGRGGLRIDLKGLEERLFRVVGGIEHHDLRPFGVLRIGFERFDALHRLLVKLRLAILHAEQDRMPVLDGLHALGRTGADERLLELGLVRTSWETHGWRPR